MCLHIYSKNLLLVIGKESWQALEERSVIQKVNC